MPDSDQRTEGESSDHKLNLLLGIDLEDVRDHIPDGSRYQDRLGFNVERILRFWMTIKPKRPSLRLAWSPAGFPASLKQSRMKDMNLQVTVRDMSS